MKTIHRMAEDLILRGADDWVMAAEVAEVVRKGGGATEDWSVRKRSLLLMRYVLENDLMAIGDLSDGGFFEWGISIDEAMGRVDRLWDGLDGPPDLGEICWLQNTDAANRMVDELLSRRSGT
jgi:hypothetical protein